MDRRTVLRFAGTAAAAAALPGVLRAQGEPPGFSVEWLDAFAQALSERSYRPPERRVASELANISYEQYQDIRFKPDLAIWRHDDLPFRLELFHTGGSFFAFPVEIFTVEAGRAAPIGYTPDLFTYGALVTPPASGSDSGFAGFRLLSQLNKPGLFDDFLMFLGASYFRARGAGQDYGLSARGLAINTGQSGGEEFPLFRSFWIERPMPGAQRITVHALLDSTNATGRFKFVATPGRATVLDVDAVIYPRADLKYVGLSPLTSMFFFAPNQPPPRADFRPRAHNSEALYIRTGANEWIWRPLINPERLQFAVFIDQSPRGYGLVQNARNFADYQDLDARYEIRPTCWVEPGGDWGAGSVDHIELPAGEEFHDNIVSFWRPRGGLTRGTAHRFQYRLHWGWAPPERSAQASLSQTRIGRTRDGAPFFVLDFVNSDTCEGCGGGPLIPNLSATGGEIRNPQLVANEAAGGHRLTFEYFPSGNAPADLRCVLTSNGRTASDTWIYRWAP